MKRNTLFKSFMIIVVVMGFMSVSAVMAANVLKMEAVNGHTLKWDAEILPAAEASPLSTFAISSLPVTFSGEMNSLPAVYGMEDNWAKTFSDMMDQTDQGEVTAEAENTGAVENCRTYAYTVNNGQTYFVAINSNSIYVLQNTGAGADMWASFAYVITNSNASENQGVMDEAQNFNSGLFDDDTAAGWASLYSNINELTGDTQMTAPFDGFVVNCMVNASPHVQMSNAGTFTDTIVG